MSSMDINEHRAMVMEDWTDYIITSEKLLDTIDVLIMMQKRKNK